ncbi:helix-turn-helix domain-containing protein, partial [Vibrio fluvialis]|nr:helix-turn-helix domain-containing protein [Vibrio fluvialis]MBY7775849.1 helix-turn-helix domain-containing protein [Vibrio fluvialis]MBY7780189.1 helix-turn-helix domain-containing protein [Vibrio fluvialis]MBY7989458.1 helix-turn-helix domain-containing protein [Vibrio fluvialis]MBY7993804.1 helix-turn-helix domain-containing protein [Vibrio fluvialis]
ALNSGEWIIRFFLLVMLHLVSDCTHLTRCPKLLVRITVAQFELAMIQERRQEGIEKAKAAGKYKGRPTNSENHLRIHQLRSKGLSLRKIASQVGVSLSTVQRALSKNVT